MDYLATTITDFQQWYAWCLSKADPRVADWLLMSAYSPTLILTLCYLVTVYTLPRLLNNRPALVLKWPLFVYNVALVALNFYIFAELLVHTTMRGYSYVCQPVDYSNNHHELRIASALWWYYFSKLIEFLDTIFFILRKKNSQVTFLHVYHHATMFPIWWIGIKWVPGGQAFFGAMINSFIHVFMYTYYGISGLGPEYQKYVWWKKYLTWLQLTQFIFGMGHAALSLVVDCDFPKWMQFSLVAYGMSMLVLFLNFYFHAYTTRKSVGLVTVDFMLFLKFMVLQQRSAEKITESEIHTRNGFVSNGGKKVL